MIYFSNSTITTQAIAKEELKHTPKSLLKQTIQSKADLKSPTIQTLLKSLSKNEITVASIKEGLKSSPLIKHSQSFTNELRSLARLIEKEPTLKHLTLPLKEFISPPDNPNRSSLHNKLLKSGIFYESNLKNQMLPLKAIRHIKNLEMYLPKAPISNNFKQKIALEIKDLLSKDTPSFKSLNKIISTLDKSINHANRYLAKKHPLLLISKNLEIIEKNLIENPKINIKSISNDLLSKLTKNEVNFQNLSKSKQKTLLDIKSILKKIVEAQDLKPTKTDYLIKNIPLKPNLGQKQLMPVKLDFVNNQIDKPITLTSTQSINSKNIVFGIISKIDMSQPQNSTNNLQIELSRAILKLKNVIKSGDNIVLKLSAALNKIDDFGLKIKASLPQLDHTTNLPKDESLNDIKRTLLNIDKATKNSETTVAKEINATANRSLNQIDFHQLYSYIHQQTHSYLPYLWEGLEDGAMKFKKDKEKMYCKIDLEFKKYKKVEILIALFDKHYISLTAGIEHPKLYSRIKSNLKTLRGLLNLADLTPHTISLFPNLKDIPYESFEKEDHFGFDFKA